MVSKNTNFFKSKKEKSKKAQEMSLTTILLMVLGIVVVVLLIWGFSTGWTNMWDKIRNFMPGGQSNVVAVQQGCDLACSGHNVGDYCTNARVVNLDNGKKIKGSCENLKTDSRIEIANCLEVTCTKSNTYNQTCADFGGDWEKDNCASSEKNVIITFKQPSDAAPKDKTFCCLK